MAFESSCPGSPAGTLGRRGYLALLLMAGLGALSWAAPGLSADNQAGQNGPSCELDQSDRALLAAVNQARSEARQCGSEQFEAAEELTWNCKLENAALAHSTDMAELGFFSHTGPGGARIADRVDARSYDWQQVGENIAAGQQSPGEVVEGWIESPGHCANIMNGAFTEMGAARVEAPNSQYSPFWTLVLARPR